MLEFAKIFTPLSEAIKVDIDILEIYLKNLEKDLENTKRYIEVLTESEEDLINGTDRLEVIKNCSKFYIIFAQFYDESNIMFQDLSNDFSDVKLNLAKETKKYGEDEDTKPIDFIKHIYTFGKDFNDAIKNMVT
jgi:hypothetical protein